MIEFHSEVDFNIEDEERYRDWMMRVASTEGYEIGDINYIFCDDEYLHELNLKYLEHDTFTDIISFDYTVGDLLQGDIFISVERVRDNASRYDVEFDEELKRVMVHGILHYCGYKDKSEKEAGIMRAKEEEKLLLFHVEQ
ncbi:rRNA maturation RNase YbeY [Sungkyunkwania multivorans]|uniref:Endoribonuclease YbeY n=1 Tax=Sungkyunkwania multivorans TaxID=1173618 RepID=A0ABW3CZB9_9FLAO